MADHRLIVRSGPSPGTVFDVTKEVTMLGRDVTNDIPLGDVEISRQHARLTRTPGGMVLEDLGSTNGTFVNGERLGPPPPLPPGRLPADPRRLHRSVHIHGRVLSRGSLLPVGDVRLLAS